MMPAVCGDRSRQEAAYFDQQRFVVGEASEQTVRAASSRQAMRNGDVLAVLLHLLGAEELRAKRRLLIGVLAERFGAGKSRPERAQAPANGPRARFQFSLPAHGFDREAMTAPRHALRQQGVRQARAGRPIGCSPTLAARRSARSRVPPSPLVPLSIGESARRVRSPSRGATPRPGGFQFQPGYTLDLMSRPKSNPAGEPSAGHARAPGRAASSDRTPQRSFIRLARCQRKPKNDRIATMMTIAPTM
jgi:hypothetical protein